MFSGITPSTEVEAVNRMLSCIGELPVSSIEGNRLNADVNAAHLKLRVRLRDIQLRGWTFNTDLNVELIRNPATGHIALPVGVVRAQPAYDKRHTQLDIKWTIRSQKLYNYTASSFIWGQNVFADIVLLLPFESLPEPVRHYITVKAAREFQAGYVGSEKYHMFTEQDEAEALAGLTEFEVDDGNHNMLNESESVVEIWRRDV